MKSLNPTFHFVQIGNDIIFYQNDYLITTDEKQLVQLDIPQQISCMRLTDDKLCIGFKDYLIVLNEQFQVVSKIFLSSLPLDTDGKIIICSNSKIFDIQKDSFVDSQFKGTLFAASISDTKIVLGTSGTLIVELDRQNFQIAKQHRTPFYPIQFVRTQTEQVCCCCNKNFVQVIDSVQKQHSSNSRVWCSFGNIFGNENGEVMFIQDEQQKSIRLLDSPIRQIEQDVNDEHNIIIMQHNGAFFKLNCTAFQECNAKIISTDAKGLDTKTYIKSIRCGDYHFYNDGNVMYNQQLMHKLPKFQPVLSAVQQDDEIICMHRNHCLSTVKQLFYENYFGFSQNAQLFSQENQAFVIDFDISQQQLTLYNVVLIYSQIHVLKVFQQQVDINLNRNYLQSLQHMGNFTFKLNNFIIAIEFKHYLAMVKQQCIPSKEMNGVCVYKNRVVTCSESQQINIFDAQAIAFEMGFQSPLKCVCTYGQFLIVGGCKNDLLCINIENRQVKQILVSPYAKQQANYRFTAVCSDGNVLVLADSLGYVHFYVIYNNHQFIGNVFSMQLNSVVFRLYFDGSIYFAGTRSSGMIQLTNQFHEIVQKVKKNEIQLPLNRILKEQLSFQDLLGIRIDELCHIVYLNVPRELGSGNDVFGNESCIYFGFDSGRLVRCSKNLDIMNSVQVTPCGVLCGCVHNKKVFTYSWDRVLCVFDENLEKVSQKMLGLYQPHQMVTIDGQLVIVGNGITWLKFSDL